MLPNPYLIIAAFIAMIGVYVFGRYEGATINEAKWQAAVIAQKESQEAALTAAAKEIAKLEVKYVTIKGKVETQIRENVVYRECKHSPDSLLLINNALRANSAGNSKLPASGGAGGLDVRGDNDKADRGGGDVLRVPGSGPSPQ